MLDTVVPFLDKTISVVEDDGSKVNMDDVIGISNSYINFKEE